MAAKYCVVCETELSGQKRKFCSNACKQKDHYYRVKSQTNTYFSQTVRSLRRKLDLIEMMGGKCQQCGYHKNLAALHFHHEDATEKEFKLDARMLSNRHWEAIYEESKKCALLCANCHSELHNPELTFKNARKIVNGASYRKR